MTDTTGDALLATILANPEEDTPRLVYADWLQENGEEERAEFIRKAIAYPHCSFLELTGGNPFELLGIPEPPAGRLVGPPSGDLLIDAANSRTWMWGESEELGCVIHDLVRNVDYREHHGFVSGVRLTLAAWEQHAADIWSRQPVTRCVLTDATPVAVTLQRRTVFTWQIGTHTPETPGFISEELYFAIDDDDPMQADWGGGYTGWPTPFVARDALFTAACLVGRRRARDRQRQTQEATT